MSSPPNPPFRLLVKNRVSPVREKQACDSQYLVLILSFILMANPDWADSKITIFTAFPKDKQEKQIAQIKHLIQKGRLPITLKNVQSYTYTDKKSLNKLIYSKSKNADLVIMGFTQKQLEKYGVEVFNQHDRLRETLFISAGEIIHIS